MREEYRNGITLVHVHGLFGANAQFHVVALEQPSEQLFGRLADARDHRSTQAGKPIATSDYKMVRFRQPVRMGAKAMYLYIVFAPYTYISFVVGVPRPH